MNGCTLDKYLFLVNKVTKYKPHLSSPLPTRTPTSARDLKCPVLFTLRLSRQTSVTLGIPVSDRQNVCHPRHSPQRPSPHIASNISDPRPSQLWSLARQQHQFSDAPRPPAPRPPAPRPRALLPRALLPRRRASRQRGIQCLRQIQTPQRQRCQSRCRLPPLGRCRNPRRGRR